MTIKENAIREVIIYSELIKTLPDTIDKISILMCARELVKQADQLRTYSERTSKELIN